MLQLIKTYKLTTVLLIVIWVLCFMPIPETPLSHVQLIDKWTHTAMYLGLGLVIVLNMSEHTTHRRVVGRYSSMSDCYPR